MCDTIVATGEATADGSVILAKNSDREPGEVQLFHRVAAQKFRKGDTVRCTNMTIPQVLNTHEVLISRPFWMWGCEMGVNSRGVAIGNEAVFTREPYSKTGLTGMDLLRLALERSSSAPDALSIITGLLESYGQGGNCGYRHKLLYHNSFIIADKKEAWVLETAGKHWVAEKVRGVRSISNGLTIGESFDRSSRGVENYARSRGYLKKHETFNFREAFSDTLYTHFSRCAIRQSRTTGLLGMNSGSLTPLDMMRMLRDHGEAGQGTPPHRTSMGTVCMHASFGPLRASQSTSALVAHLRSAFPVYWATGTSGTCTGVFKPVYLMGKDLGFLNSDAEKTFSPEVAWWRHELLHRQAIMKYSFWNNTCAPERNALEEKFIRAEDRLRRAAGKGGKGITARAIRFSETCHEEAAGKTGEWIGKLDRVPAEKGIPFLYRMFWKGQDRLARLPRRD